MAKSLTKRAKGPIVAKDTMGKDINRHAQNDFTTQNYPHGTGKDGLTLTEQKLLREFFTSSTAVFSGAERETRAVEIPQHEWEQQLYTKWPSILRTLCRSQPELL
jgi:hypothetical protein